VTDEPRSDDATTASGQVETWRLTGREDLEIELAIRHARLAGLGRRYRERPC
jgi:hypothetical protein